MEIKFIKVKNIYGDLKIINISQIISIEEGHTNHYYIKLNSSDDDVIIDEKQFIELMVYLVVVN